MSMAQLIKMNGVPCPCGREHRFDTRLYVGAGVIRQLPESIRALGGSKVYLLTDAPVWEGIAQILIRQLEQAGIPCTAFCYPAGGVKPEEHAVGAAVMHYAPDCDILVGVGSGVINDIGKLVSKFTGLPYIIVATAPSMDGYASATSSMDRDGVKISLPSRAPDAIFGDTDILCTAPMILMQAGLGDMLAKYVSVCEWRIAHLLLGEYYCESIARLIRDALSQCVSQAQGLLRREPQAVQAVFEGLVIGGIAMQYAGLSRPASGCEHYISHVIDMRAVEFGTKSSYHGLQCAVGTLIVTRLYEKLQALIPDWEKALAHAAGFDRAAWNETLRTFLGTSAETMIALEEKEKKYDPVLHGQRLEKILASWQDILSIVREELPPAEALEALLREIGAPTCLDELGVEEALLPTIFQCTKDIRDKYVLSRLLWDLGILDEMVF